MMITWPMFLWGFGILVAWTTFLLGIIKYLLTRQLTAFVAEQAKADAKATAADEKAAKALANLTKHKEAMTKVVAELRIEFDRKSICGNHGRMEDNDKRLFGRLDQLHGDIRELVGGVKALTKSMEVINQHLLDGGK